MDRLSDRSSSRASADPLALDLDDLDLRSLEGRQSGSPSLSRTPSRKSTGMIELINRKKLFLARDRGWRNLPKVLDTSIARRW